MYIILNTYDKYNISVWADENGKAFQFTSQEDADTYVQNFLVENNIRSAHVQYLKI